MTAVSKIRKVVREILLELEDANLDEYGGQFAEESEIIYRDSNVVAIIPKSQMASKTYRKGTKWCSTESSGFNLWAKQGLLIRFLFKGGRKIRLTYLFDGERYGHDYDWASENGHHILPGYGNPFEAKLRTPEQHGFKHPDSSKAVIDLETDILKLITSVSQECKTKVLEFIEQHRKTYDYCYKEEEYSSQSAKRKEFETEEIKLKYEHLFERMRKKNPDSYVAIRYSKSKNKFNVYHSTKGWSGPYINEFFIDEKPAEKRYAELITQYTNMPIKKKPEMA